MPTSDWTKRVDAGDWGAIAAGVNDFGGALLPRLLTTTEARRLRKLYAKDELFRATIDMELRRYGSGQYRVASCQDAREGGFVASSDCARLGTRALAVGPALLVVILRSWAVRAWI